MAQSEQEYFIFPVNGMLVFCKFIFALPLAFDVLSSGTFNIILGEGYVKITTLAQEYNTNCLIQYINFVLKTLGCHAPSNLTQFSIVQTNGLDCLTLGLNFLLILTKHYCHDLDHLLLGVQLVIGQLHPKPGKDAKHITSFLEFEDCNLI